MACIFCGASQGDTYISRQQKPVLVCTTCFNTELASVCDWPVDAAGNLLQEQLDPDLQGDCSYVVHQSGCPATPDPQAA